MAYTNIQGRIIDLNSKDLKWYSIINPTKVIPTPWDESEAQYPNLTNAIYQSLNDSFEIIRSQLLGPKPQLQTTSN